MAWLGQLKRMKASSGMTTKEISVKSGIPEPTLEKLFSGQTKDPKLNTVVQLVHFLGYTLDDLVPSQTQEKEPTDLPIGELSENEKIENEKIFMSLPPNLRQEALRYMRYLAEQEDKR